VPEGVEVNIAGNEVVVKGSKGEIRRRFHRDISIKLEDKTLVVLRHSDDKTHRALHGLTRSLLANMVQGVSQGFEKVLEVSGVGYRVQEKGGKLSFQVGYSHPVEFQLPGGISASVEGTNRVRISGINKEIVGEVAAQIRAIHPPDSYKGKGIKYAGSKSVLSPARQVRQQPGSSRDNG